MSCMESSVETNRRPCHTTCHRRREREECASQSAMPPPQSFLAPPPLPAPNSPGAPHFGGYTNPHPLHHHLPNQHNQATNQAPPPAGACFSHRGHCQQPDACAGTTQHGIRPACLIKHGPPHARLVRHQSASLNPPTQPLCPQAPCYAAACPSSAPLKHANECYGPTCEP